MGCGPSKPDINPNEVDMSHFVVGACIGKGGFGKVHAVIHKGSGVQMAMKKLEKNRVLQKKWQIDTVWAERNLLELLSSPYTNRLYFALQTKWELFLIMPFMRGGDLAWYLCQNGAMKTPVLRYYAAEILLGFEELRRLNIVYRDMKPENCLFNDEGHLCITDFGICAKLSEANDFKLTERMGTMQYMAPEQIRKEPYDYSVDYWAFGLTLFEMACNQRVFKGQRNVETEDEQFWKGKLVNVQDPQLRDLIAQLLNLNAEERLGVKDFNDVLQHQFFSSIDWNTFRKLEQDKPPFTPKLDKLNASMDTVAMDAFGDMDEPEDKAPPSEEEQKIFEHFEFNNKPKDTWIEYWSAENADKSKSQRARLVSQLWDRPIDMNAFRISTADKLTVDMSAIDIDILKPMAPQVNSSECEIVEG